MSSPRSPSCTPFRMFVRRWLPPIQARSQRTAMQRSSSSTFAATRARQPTRSSPVLDRIAVAQRAHPQFFIGEFGEASAEAAVADNVREGPGKGGCPVDSDHADHPAGRLRSARRRRNSAPPRADSCLRDARRARPAQPPAAAGERGPGNRAPRRPRRRRRLLDVLLEARARRTGRRSRPTGGDRSRRGNLRPLGAHLRADCHGGDGRHVPDR